MTDDQIPNIPQPVAPSAPRLQESPAPEPGGENPLTGPEPGTTPPHVPPLPESAPTESFRGETPQPAPASEAPAAEPAPVERASDLPTLPGGLRLGKSMVDPEGRASFGRQMQKMKAAPIPGYMQRWFNDTPGRIAEALSVGYVHVQDADGKPITLTVGTKENGDGLNAYLMAIPQHLYDADFAEKQAKDDEIDAALNRGRIDEKPGDNRYVPEGMIKIDASRRPR